MQETLYARLGGYDAISAVVNELLSRLTSDAQLGRFWRNRGIDGLAREKQLLINFLCASMGGPVLYTGRDNKTSHGGMGISEDDWVIFLGHWDGTLEKFSVPDEEKGEVLALINRTKSVIVDG